MGHRFASARHSCPLFCLWTSVMWDSFFFFFLWDSFYVGPEGGPAVAGAPI